MHWVEEHHQSSSAQPRITLEFGETHYKTYENNGILALLCKTEFLSNTLWQPFLKEMLNDRKRKEIKINGSFGS